MSWWLVLTFPSLKKGRFFFSSPMVLLSELLKSWGMLECARGKKEDQGKTPAE